MNLYPQTQTQTQTQIHTQRQVYMVLSPHSLSYARFALESLFRNAAEPMHLRLITDSQADKATFAEELTLRQNPSSHRWSLVAEQELADREADVFSRYPNLRLFRHGHPCWRKITDPLLLSAGNDREEMVLLDPDLYFPNPFRFQTTPQTGLLLMWQKPNCLVPAHTLRAAMQKGIRFAHHVDIGVAQWRGPDALAALDWLEWLLDRLDIRTLPRVMHIEAIVWSALAMRIGGGYLDPDIWQCWRRSQPKRILRKLGIPGVHLLRLENFASMQCFHAGGEAKWWLADAARQGLLSGKTPANRNSTPDLSVHPPNPGRILPFEELLPKNYTRELRLKSLLGKLGYYSLFHT